MVNLEKLTKKRLGELLVEEGLLKEEQVADALVRQKQTGELLGEALVKLGYVSEYDIARSITRQFNLPFINAENYTIPLEVLSLVPTSMMLEHHFVLMDRIGKTLIIAVAGLLKIETLEEIERIANAKLFIYVTTSSSILAAIRKYQPDAIPAKR